MGNHRGLGVVEAYSHCGLFERTKFENGHNCKRKFLQVVLASEGYEEPNGK